MINVTMRQLRYFDALARHGHFGRAAESCSISQPALSMQIKELEEALGGLLLERSARQVALTRFGEELAQRVRDILRSVDELGDFARASQDRFAGRLRIGMIPTIAPYLLPKITKNLTRMHPELDIRVRETMTPRLIQELVEGRLDTAIVALPVSEPSLTEVALFEEKFLLVRPGSDAGTPVPSREMMREMRLLLLEEGHCFRDQALSFCNMQSAPPREMLDANSLSTLVQMVSAGIGVTLIPEMAVSVETRSASVSLSRFRDPEPSRTIGMVWRKTSPLARQLLQISEVVCLSAGKVRQRQARAVNGPEVPMSQQVIRPARADEYDEVARVWMESWVSTGLAGASEFLLANLRARIRREMENGWSLFVADDNGTIAAMLALHVPKLCLDMLFVGPGYQGQSLGRQLLAFTRTQMPDEVCLRCVRENEKAWRWYEREGFVFEKEEVEPSNGLMMKYYRWKRQPAE